jgi:hypothetical protein
MYNHALEVSGKMCLHARIFLLICAGVMPAIRTRNSQTELALTDPNGALHAANELSRSTI